MDMADLQARMKDPATMEMMSNMMKSMKAEDLASIASASGMNISTSQVVALSHCDIPEYHSQVLHMLQLKAETLYNGEYCEILNFQSNMGLM